QPWTTGLSISATADISAARAGPDTPRVSCARSPIERRPRQGDRTSPRSSYRVLDAERPVARAGPRVGERPLLSPRSGGGRGANGPPAGGRGQGAVVAGVRSVAIAQTGRPGCGAAMGKRVSRKRGGAGPPHWLIVPGRIGQRRGR